MIPNLWYAILDSGEVPRGRPVGVMRLGEKLVLWRDSRGDVNCQRDLCPHRGAALSAGKVRDNCVVCPFHGFAFDPVGKCRLVPANGKNTPPPKILQIHTYPARDAFGFIWIYWGESPAELPPLPFFEDLANGFSYATYPYPWKTHYSRAIENQLDVIHLPFVHYNTIGRGNHTLVDGPVSTLEDDVLRLWVYNRRDDGTPPRRADEIPVPTREPMLYFRFPNIWQNNIAPDYRIVVAFAPVDDEHTILYLRVYQRFVRIPILRSLVNLLNILASIYITWQDKTVVETQRPLRTDLRIGEHPIQGDNPIIQYRRRRRELLDAAGLPEMP
jgi:phenylpropionate dioxygenase-like ring-hydroxylating dioxygenase large terminal subunit